MMNERLKLARELLNDDGLIFISIDDNEQAYLKVLCDEIFGEENFIANLIWRNKNTGGGSNKLGIDIETEFILLYAKDKKKVSYNAKEVNSANYSYEDEYVNERGKYNLTDLDHVCSLSSFQYIASLDYEIQAPDGTMFKNHRNKLKPKSYCYTLSKELFDFSLKNGFIHIIQKKDSNGETYWKAYRKSYEKVIISSKPYSIIPREQGNNFNNIISNCESIENEKQLTNTIMNGSITTSSGKRTLIKILDNKDFSFPKPVALIKYLINIHPKKDITILDFFAGSGTTGQAVMELNQEDDGERSFILVTNNENNIGEKITYERLYRVINGVGTKNEEIAWKYSNDYPSLVNNSLEVYTINKYYLSINDVEKANKLISEAKESFTKFNPNYKVRDLDIYNQLASLTPYKEDK